MTKLKKVPDRELRRRGQSLRKESESEVYKGCVYNKLVVKIKKTEDL